MKNLKMNDQSAKTYSYIQIRFCPSAKINSNFKFAKNDSAYYQSRFQK